MNRQQALAWLVENVTRWPVFPPSKRFCDWIWCWSLGGNVIFSDDESVITQSDWLDATDNMEKREDE